MDQGRISNYRLIIFGTVFYLLWKMPIVSLYCNTYIAMLVLIMTFVLILNRFGFSLKRFSKYYAIVAIYILFDGISQFGKSANILNFAWGLFLDLFPLVIGYALIRYEADDIISKATVFIILTTIVTAITTSIGLQAFPNASRELATGSGLYQLYYRYNIGGFSFVYGLVLLHPMMVCFFKIRRKQWLAVIISIISGICVLESSYTTAILVFFITCIVYGFPAKEENAFKYKVIIMGLIVIVASYFFLPYVLRYIAGLDIFGSSSGKINDLANILQGNTAVEYDTNARIRLYSQSWDTFLANPIFGTRLMGSSSKGGHSFVLDFLSDFGIIGGIVLFLMYKALFSNIKYYIAERPVTYYAYFTMIMAIVLSFLNPNMWLFSIGIMIPVLGKKTSTYVLLQKEDDF